MALGSPAARAVPLATPRDLRVAVVSARFNARVVDELLAGCEAELRERGVALGEGDRISVPGAWELPVACRWIADAGTHDAIVALGVVIRGDTPHFEFVAGGAMRGCMDVATSTGVPVIFGVLTTETEAQALDRASRGAGNKGREFAEAALELGSLRRLHGRARRGAGEGA